MAEIVQLSRSVGRGGTNLPIDVVKVGAALVALGPDQGGVYAPPLSIEGLGQAIQSFQEFQNLTNSAGRPVRDGRIDPGGMTLNRINSLLDPSWRPPGPPIPPTPTIRTGQVRRLPAPDGLASAVDANTWCPIEQSLTSEYVFRWTGVAGRGSIQYFELDDDVVPNWFGVVVPAGVGATQNVHIFFHPTPAQAGYVDANYRNKTGWTPLFHYMTDSMSAQFCAAGTGQVLIMPLMTQSAAGTCGVFPQRWESIVGQILGLIAAGPSAQTADPVNVASVVVSSFSSGITYSANFRSRAQFGGRLRAIIDFDGIISSYRHYSQALAAGSAHPVVQMQQADARESALPTLAARNFFPLARPRWGTMPYTFPPPGYAAMMQVHGAIPQSMMFIAASRTSAV